MALSKQKMFMDSCMQMGGSSNFVGGGLDKLLMGVNPRTGKSSHLINVAKRFLSVVDYTNPVSSGGMGSGYQLIEIISLEDFSKSLLCGFSLCLENENFEVNDDIDELLDKDFTSPVSQVQLGESVLNLLIGSLNLPAPNMSHFLCGFDTKRHIHKTMLHDPGINNFPRTCIHSVVSILNRSIDQPLKKHRHMYPRFYELAYQFIHCLCTDVNTCVPVLRYLRSHDFLYKQSSKLPFASVPNSTAKASASLSSSLLAQQSWLLSSLVVDLKVSADNKQRSYVQRVIELLLGVDVKSSSKMFLSDVCSTEQKDENKLQLLLSTISLSSDPPPPISHLNVFNPSQVQQISSMCEVLSSNNLTFCDVKTVYRILIEECSGLTGPLFSRREKALEEINNICSNIMQQNAHKRSVHANKQAFLAWRQAVEVILTVVPLQQFAGEKRLQVILDLLQSLLHKLMPDLNSIVSHQASYVILILVDNLARCFILDQSANQSFHSHGSSLQQDISVVRGRANEVVGMRSAFSTLLQTVLDGLIRYLLGSGSNGQRLRVHLYASLLYFLEIADKPQEFQHGIDQGVQRFLSPKENEYDKLSSDNLSTIKKYSEPLLSCLCRDICDGHDVTKMLSMSVLDKVLLIDTQKMWLNDVSSCGCIQHVTNGISADDHHLKLMLNPDPVPLKTLFIFQSKMSLLSRIARTREGANVLLSCDVMSHLAACSVLSLRPKHEGGYPYENSGFVPSILSRYRHHILFPIVRLSLTLISSLGSDNAAISKVFLFVMAHVETFTNIISMHPQDIRTMESLKELHLVVALLSSIAHESIIEEVMLLDAMYGDVKMCLNRLQRPIINLLNRFSICGEQTSNMIKQIKNNLVHNYADHGDAFYDDDLNPDSTATDQSSDVGQKIMTIVEEILSNSLALCRSIINESRCDWIGR
ncbi:hypothetical protein HELRODRAFT_187835, partial [Helobdella robusta]|uniref:Uncharacterized protein n=1 Tax=Helobdella robusta TaxID=6412 RepID=T1FPF0_HELRO